MNAKKNTSWFKTMAAACAASLMASGAQGAELVTVDKVANHYPWDGKVDCVTTLSGMDASVTYDGVFTLSVTKDGVDVRKTVTNALANTDGTYTNTFDCTALFGAGAYPVGGIAVKLIKNLGGVQLWKDGPYWAECNVGATKPEEYGYYFWWGDTVGYTNNGSAWISVKYGTTIEFSSEAFPANLTYGKDIATLKNMGFIDSTGNLVAGRDAATAYLGAPWRMPTGDEIKALKDNCTTVMTTENSVYGCRVTGKGDYATKSIFLPSAGIGSGSGHYIISGDGDYWSSTPNSDDSNFAWYLYFDWSTVNMSNVFNLYRSSRTLGQSVRPLRGFAQ